MNSNSVHVSLNDPILVTGATGFIGSRVVADLLARGFTHIKCFTRPTSNTTHLLQMAAAYGDKARLEVINGNLLSTQSCANAAKDVTLIFHLAAARGEKSIPDAFMNSVVTTRNLLDAARKSGSLKRFVNVSSFAVYTNCNKPHGRLLDEDCPTEQEPGRRGDAYTFAKVKQEQIVRHYGEQFGVPFVVVRPGYVYGPGNEGLTGRVGIGTFGVFLHLGGGNTIPITFVDNCARAIVAAGLCAGIDGQTFNVVDDDLPSSRTLLRMYKRNVRRFRSLYVPHIASYALCYAWERYSDWSMGQLPSTYNRGAWHAFWKSTHYSNDKLKRVLGWTPTISTAEGLAIFFESCRKKAANA